MDRLVRDWDCPPYDSLAEAMVLYGLLTSPWLIGQYELGPLLVYPEHRTLWASMQRVHERFPHLSYGQFTVAWWNDLKQEYPEHWEALGALVDDAWSDERRWMDARYSEARADDPGAPVAFADFSHTWLEWLERLQRVADARHLIATAQEIASRAWRVDTDGARRVAADAGIAQSQPLPRAVGERLRADFGDLDL